MPFASRSLAAVVALCLTAHAQALAWRISEVTAHNQTTRLLTTESANPYRSADGTLKRVTLQIKCSGPLTTSATVSADSPETFAVKSDSTVTLPIRLDGEPAVHVGWANLSLHQILIYNLRDLLPPHRRMSIDLPLGAAAPQILIFDLSDLASTMRDQNCRRRIQ